MRLIASLGLFLLLITGGSTQISMELQTCSTNANVVIVADASRSFAEHTDIVAAVQAVVTEILDNNANIRIGVVFYGLSTQQIQLTNNFAILSTISANNQQQGFTNTNLGINAAVTMLTSAGNNLPGHIIVITDAISTNPQLTENAAIAARQAGYTTYALSVNVDSEAYYEESYSIAGAVSRIYVAGSIAEMRVQALGLADSICALTVCSACTYDYGPRIEAHPARCDQYYQCEKRNGYVNAYVKTCPLGTLWHRRKMTCDWPVNVLRETDSGCGWCDDGVTNHPFGDSCEIYYSCALRSDGNYTLDQNCCPAGLTFNPAFNVRSCQQQPTVCPQSNYYDSVSCRGYYGCELGQVQHACCNSGEAFNATSGNCEPNTSCLGGCRNATMRWCEYLRAHPTDICRFQVLFSNRTFNFNCPALSRFSINDCGCIRDDLSEVSCPVTAQVCTPNIRVTFSETREHEQGFTESERGNYIGTRQVGFPVFGQAFLNGSAGIDIPVYKTANEFMGENLFFRIGFREEPDLFDFSNPYLILTNQRCDAINPSIYIGLRDNGNGDMEMIFRVVTENDGREILITFPEDFNAYKEVTFRITPNEIQANVQLYYLTGNVRTNGPVYFDNIDHPGGLTYASDCGFHIGEYEQQRFLGFIDFIYMDTECDSVPAVNVANPTDLF